MDVDISSRIKAISGYKRYRNVYWRLKNFALNREADDEFYAKLLDVMAQLSYADLEQLEHYCVRSGFSWVEYMAEKCDQQAARDRARLFHNRLNEIANPWEEIAYLRTPKKVYQIAIWCGIATPIAFVVPFFVLKVSLAMSILWAAYAASFSLICLGKIRSDRKGRKYFMTKVIPLCEMPVGLKKYREEEGDNVTLLRRG